ncbi:pimeloyl-ACP methyl ester carboxylesterase [Scopulibacillus daqui]|uniref:Pimeloyl-ACP methyl ester carboxylesterase n=1 Tax=Scopulibacillus daqui TaxID=1469162 RepID=A0ABS2PZL6_9BACL|nr:alpha/beta hydrolase [Scopulibacillus daqui]MBM7645401.1 pimeloyl-ACP methyl ester carboxylesterase [Scopulibacillus daqui]
MPFFETSSGVRLYYERHGQGKPLIFIHPPLLGHVIFKYQKILSEKYQVILYDCRGHGQSTYQKGDDVIKDHTVDLYELITHLNLEKPIIVGYSNGGFIAINYALEYPDKIGAMILSGGYPEVRTGLLAFEYYAGIWLMKRRYKHFLSRLLAKTHKITDEDEAIIYRYSMMADIEAVLDLYQSGIRYSKMDQLYRLKELPSLLVYGTITKHIYKHKMYFENRMNQLDVVKISRATHQIPTRFHKSFNSAIDQFLSRFH